jgi:CO dehydrogenase maturation factor
LEPEISEEIKRQNLTLAGVIPTDEEVYRYDLEGRPTFQLPMESKAVQAARRIFEEYIH